MVLYLGVSLKSAGSLMLAALTCKCSLTEAPAGYPYKNSNNRKNRKRAGDDGKREKAGTSAV